MASEENRPAKRRREVVPVALVKIRVSGNPDDCINIGDEVPKHLLPQLTEKKKDKRGKYPAIYDYEMASFVAADAG